MVSWDDEMALAINACVFIVVAAADDDDGGGSGSTLRRSRKARHALPVTQLELNVKASIIIVLLLFFPPLLNTIILW